ncbi:CBS domain-containing protein [Candidatus Aerophobetes bacterium]|nr:CBS domain-containing protein [Candidatus Aerophobetes bacterium]
MQIITAHTGCDFDALSSMVAAGKLYPEAKLCFSGVLSREVRDFMRLYGWMVPVVKVSRKDLDKVKRLILVDTRWINRIGIFKDLIGKKGVEIHIYDHHPPHPGDIQGDAGVCREVGATTSILVDLIKKRGIPVTPFEATLLCLGIYEDTGSLSFSSTTSLDLQSAAFLLERGANLELISSFLNRGLSEKQNLLLKSFLENSKIKMINGVEIFIIGVEIEDFVGGISLPLRKFIDLKNPDVTFAIVRSKEKVYLMARSRNPSINVGEILSFFKGGGHNLAASAIIKNKDIEEVEKELYRVLEKNIHPGITVGQIMRSPVSTVSPDTPVGEVEKIMQEDDLEILPVQEKQEIIGVISREKVKNVISHSSINSPVKSYYSRKFISISPFVSLKKAQQTMMEEDVSYLFVFQGEKFMGVLTGLDLFKAFHKDSRDFSSENLKDKLKEKVPPGIVDILLRAGKLAYSMGWSVFIVGGFVRDLLLGNENFDIDLVIEGDGILYAEKLSEELGANLTIHRDFGTATLNLSENFKLDIATSRREFYPRPASLPHVKPAPLKEDLFRRDFTVNAMAISINPPDFGRLIDFFGGRRDLRERKVRVLHVRSFIDDPTRIFRAIRFEQRYNFCIEKVTERLIKLALREGVFQLLSGKRIKEELKQILEEDRPERNVYRMQKLGILKVIQPGIYLNSSREMIFDKLIDTIARYEILTGEKSKRWLIRLSVLLRDLTEEEIENFCSKYSFTREERETILASSKKADEIVERLTVPEMKPSSIYYLLRSYPPEALILAMAIAKDDIVEKRIVLYLSHLQKIELEITGDDLKKMGYKPSPEFSRILEETKKAKLDGLVKTVEEEVEFIRKNFAQGENR